MGRIKAAAARRPARRGSAQVGGYEFEGRIASVRRRRTGPPQPVESDGAMEEFLRTPTGVEALSSPRPS